MNDEQYKNIITNQFISQTLLIAILKILGIEAKEIDELVNLGEKATNKFLKEMEKKNGK